MPLEQLNRKSQPSSVISWIANTDAAFFTVILLLAVFLVVRGQLHTKKKEIRKLQDEFQIASTSIAHLKLELADLVTLAYDLQQQLTTTQDEKEKYQRLLADAEAWTDLLWQVYNSLQQQLTKSQDENENLQRLLADTEMWTDLLWEIHVDLQQKWAAIREEREKLVGQLAQTLKEKETLAKKVEELEDYLAAGGRKALNRKLVGLNGALDRVAILCDISGSMNDEGRWTHALDIIDAWLSCLQVDHCVVILFNSEVSVLPADGSLLDVRLDPLDPEGKKNERREWLRKQLKEVKPNGQTNTAAALEKAYQYATAHDESKRIQTIILFTDGAPSDRTTGEFTPALAERVYTLCRQHENNKIPVNTIGLGNYFKPELSQFLMRVAEMTGGNFLGR